MALDSTATRRWVARVLRAFGRRCGEGDIAGLADLVALRGDLDRSIEVAVRGLRNEPWCYTWGEVAASLGVSRQAAERRYGHVDGPTSRRRGAQPAALR